MGMALKASCRVRRFKSLHPSLPLPQTEKIKKPVAFSIRSPHARPCFPLVHVPLISLFCSHPFLRSGASFFAVDAAIPFHGHVLRALVKSFLFQVA